MQGNYRSLPKPFLVPGFARSSILQGRGYCKAIFYKICACKISCIVPKYCVILCGSKNKYCSGVVPGHQRGFNRGQLG